jgi:hypothetical protein
MRLGELLLAMGVCSPSHLREALETQVLLGGRLGTNLLELGALREEQLAAALARQHGVPTLHGNIAIDRQIAALFKPEQAERFEVIPYALAGRRLTVLCCDPFDLAKLDEVAFATGKQVVPVVVPEARLWALLRTYYRVERSMRGLDFDWNRGPSRPAPAAEQAAAAVTEDLVSEEEFAALYGDRLNVTPAPIPAPDALRTVTPVPWSAPAAPAAPAPAPRATAAPQAPAPTQRAAAPAPAGRPPAPQAPPGRPPPAPPSAAPAAPLGAPAPPRPPAAPPTGAPPPLPPRASPAPSPSTAAPASPAARQPPPASSPAVRVPPSAPPSSPPAPAARAATPLPSAAAPPGPPAPALATPPAPPAARAGPPAAAPLASAPPTAAPPPAAPPAPGPRAAPPAEPPPQPLSFAEAVAALNGVADRNAIARVVLRHARSRFHRAMLLTVHARGADGWEGIGEGLTPQVVARVHVVLGQPGVIQTVVESRSHFLGPLGRTEANVRLLRALAGGAPKNAFAMPVLARGKVVNVLYADNGRGQLVDSDGVGELLILATKISQSYDVLLNRAR